MVIMFLDFVDLSIANDLLIERVITNNVSSKISLARQLIYTKQKHISIKIIDR